MKRNKLKIIMTSLLAVLIFGVAVSATVHAGAGQTAPYKTFELGSTDQEILNGGTILQDGNSTYYSESDGLYRSKDGDLRLISDDPAENINADGNSLYYTVSVSGVCEIKVLDLNTLEERTIIALDSEIGQMYLVNSADILYSVNGTIYKLNLGTEEIEGIETAGDVFSFFPTEYGIVYGVGDLFNVDVYAGSRLIAERAISFYSDCGYLLVENSEGEQRQVKLENAFNGLSEFELLSIYSTVSLDEILCEDDDCDVCEANYNELLNGDIRLSSYQLQEISDSQEGYVRTLSMGQNNVVLRARQQAEIEWTPLRTVSGWRGEYTFTAGTTYYGIPYGQPVTKGYFTPYDASFATFASSVRNPSSEFYTSKSVYGNKTSTYYASDCSAFVSWAWGLQNRNTTSTLNYRGTVIGKWSIYSFQVGDILNLPGSHTVLISNVEYDANGAVSAVEIMEQTPPICKTTRYGNGGTAALAEITNRYGRYSLVRHKDIDSVVYTPDENNPIGETGGVFADVLSDKWYYEAVGYVYKNSLFNGTSTRTFSPEAAMTRGQLVTVLGRMSGVSGDALNYTGTITGSKVNFRSGPGTSHSIIGSFLVGDRITVISRSDEWLKVSYNGKTGYVHGDYIVGTFPDVKASAYYSGYIEWAYTEGIVQGHTATSFVPDDPLTREQMCTLLCRYANYSKVTIEKVEEAITFTDASSISKYAREYVKMLQSADIINGIGDGTFAPLQACTRAQVASMLMNYHKSYVQKAAI